MIRLKNNVEFITSITSLSVTGDTFHYLSHPHVLHQSQEPATTGPIKQRLVINGLAVGTHTHIHINLHESDFKKPGTCWPAAGMFLVKK